MVATLVYCQRQNPAYWLLFNRDPVKYLYILWLAPFLAFTSGYYLVRSLYHINELQTPSLVGKTVIEAFKTISESKLNLALLAEKEDADLPHGTILSQTPIAGSSVKPHQSIYCVITKQPDPHIVPELTHLPLASIEKILTKKGIKYKVYHQESLHPHHHCFAQYPQAGMPLSPEEPLTLYISNGMNRPLIWPSFAGQPVAEVHELLQGYGITPTIKHQPPLFSRSHQCTNCRVTDQRPLAGSLVTLHATKPIQVQLSVK